MGYDRRGRSLPADGQDDFLSTTGLGAGPTALAADTGADFTGFYAAWFRPVRSRLFMMTGSPGLADDLAQEAFLRAWANWDRWEDQGFARSAWVFRIAHNLTIDYFRRAEHAHTAGSLEANEVTEWVGPAAPSEIETAPERLDLTAAIRQLGLRDRQLLTLVAAGFSRQEMAAHMGVALPTLRTQLHRIRTRLRDRLTTGSE